MKNTHNKEVFYVNILIGLLFIVMLLVGYISIQTKIEAMKREVKTTQQELKYYIQTGVNSVYYLSTLAEELHTIKDKFDLNLSKEVHSINRDEFALDKKGMSNLTGHGGLKRSEEILREMELSLALNEQFKVANQLNKDYEWIYYISKYKFLTMYPYIDSSKYIWHYENSLKAVWQLALPENNPKRELFFTPLYVDGAGKGLMVTIGKPVYENNDFKGTLDVDITVKALSQFLDRHNLHKGTYVLVNQEDQIIAASGLNGFKTDTVFTVDDLLPSDIIDQIKKSKEKISVSKYYLYQNDLEIASWKLYYYKERFSVYSHSFLYLFFIFFIILLLFRLKHLMMNLDQSNKKLEKLASLDPMTELYNKRYFSDISEKVFLSAKTDDHSFTLIILDIDNFKKINDTYGHLAGDKIIIDASDILKKSLRSNDVICRYGGEEFIILLDNVKLENAIKIAEKIRQKMEHSKVKLDENRVLNYTTSFGVTHFKAKEDITMQDVILRADKALYKAKELGKNRIEVL